MFSVGKREAAWWDGLPLCFLRFRPQVKIDGLGYLFIWPGSILHEFKILVAIFKKEAISHENLNFWVL